MSDKQLHLAVASKEPYEAPSVRTMTVFEAKEQLHASLDDGVECPVCGQFAKVYKRALRGALVVSLIHIYRYFREHPAAVWLDDTPKFLREHDANATNDVALLRHWKLIAAQTGERGDGSKRIGVFQITPEGRAFVIGVLKVPRFAVIYNQDLLKLDGPLISVKDALGLDFDYSALMEGR